MRKLFIAEDGREFENEKECKRYEEELRCGELECIFCGGVMKHYGYNGVWGYTDGGEYLECKDCNTIIKREAPNLDSGSVELLVAYKGILKTMEILRRGYKS